MQRALSEYSVKGVKTTISFHTRVLKNPLFLSGDFDTNFIENQFRPQDEQRIKPHEDVALLAAVIKAFRRDKEAALRMMGGGCCAEASPWKASGRVKRESGF
jgi:acetyl/propionyl-CoA carboxylase alpha subunit